MNANPVGAPAWAQSSVQATEAFATSSAADAPPLFVDLDGTLLKTDSLVEALFSLARRDIAHFLLAPLWLRQGKAAFKQRIAEHVDLDVGNLPLQSEFLTFLHAEAARGRRIVLATAANERYAQRIADALGVFTDVIASDGKNNLSGAAKLARIEAYCAGQPFAYAGNAYVDLPIFARASEVILVNPLPGVEPRARAAGQVARVFCDRPPLFRATLKALRWHQWLKNVLIAVPMLAAHQIDASTLTLVVLAMISFSLGTSAMYLLNDLLDLAADRQHSRKRQRMLAAGELPIEWAVFAVPGLTALSLALAWWLSPAFSAVLVLYMLVTTSYSLYLKRKELVDVLTLAGLYTLRVIAGAAVIDVAPSFWLLAFSIFVFFSLALVKRCAELHAATTGAELPGRGYRPEDLDYLRIMGIVAGYLSVLVIAFYINSENVMELYGEPVWLWALCPVWLYWMSRVWLKVARGEMHDDPLIFALRDRTSLFVFAVLGVIVWAASNGVAT